MCLREAVRFYLGNGTRETSDSRYRVGIVTNIVETVYCHAAEFSGAVQLQQLSKIVSNLSGCCNSTYSQLRLEVNLMGFIVSRTI